MNVEAEIDSIKVNIQQLRGRVRDLEDQIDTFVLTPWWKKVLFFIDGWSLSVVQDKPQWRPWRKWWTS